MQKNKIYTIIAFMQDNLAKIKKLPLILEARRIEIKEVITKLDPGFVKIAHENDRNIFVYRIVYKSQGHRVVGYIVEPKKGNKLPNVIWNRGGSNDYGAITLGQLFTSIAEFAKNGYITITTQYSGNGGS